MFTKEELIEQFKGEIFIGQNASNSNFGFLRNFNFLMIDETPFETEQIAIDILNKIAIDYADLIVDNQINTYFLEDTEFDPKDYMELLQYELNYFEDLLSEEQFDRFIEVIEACEESLNL